MLLQIQAVGVDETAKIVGLSRKELLQKVEERRYRSDFHYFAGERLWIMPKIGDVQRFRLNRPQRRLLEARDRQRAKGKAVRIRLLKARQWGGSTEIQGWIFGDTILREGRRSMTVAHSIESATHLRDMSERYYDRYDLIKPSLKKQTDKTWKFQHKRDGKLAESLMRIDTAENVTAGHSMTTNNLHCSELQAWPHGDVLLRGLTPMVPDDPDTMIIEEGTGSGVGDFWYERCELARTGLTEWEFVFVPWFELEDTTTPFEDDKFAFEKSLDGEEKHLHEQGITLEQLHWRRRTIENKFKGDEDGFKQQYPANPDEAFLTSGRPVFHAATVQKRLREAPIGKEGYFAWSGKGVKFVPEKNGYWKIFNEPVEGINLYCWGADPVEGREIQRGLGNRGGDKAGVRFLRRDHRKFVATLSARLDPDVLAEEIAKATTYYGMAQGLPELNAGGGGQLLIARLKEWGVKMLRLPVLGKRDDDLNDNILGFETTVKSKRYLIDNMVEEIREGRYTDPDREVWEQCATYVRDERGKMEAQSQKFDDLVMATALTLQADRMLPATFKVRDEIKEEIPRDVDVASKGITQDKLMEENYANF
jgi:hypothetical protein